VDRNVFTAKESDQAAGAAEHCRIAGHQPDNPLARLGKPRHPAADLVLPAARPPLVPADLHTLCLAPGEFQNLRRNQVIEENDVGGLQGAHGLEGQ